MDTDTSVVAGTVVADTPRQARDQLRERGLTITHVEPAAARRAHGGRGVRGRRGSQVVAFIRQLQTLLGAGIPLVSALGTLSAQHGGRFRSVIQQLGDDVAAGISLAEAMERQPAFFDQLCVSIVAVGQNTGSLETALGKLADFKEKAHRLRSRITTALMYPAIVCVIGTAVAVFLMTYVVPNLLGTLSQAGKELPAVTRAVKAASDLLIGWWWLLVAAVLAIMAAGRAALRTDKGHLFADRLVLKIPVVGELIRKENVSRMSVVLAALLGSGLQFTEALRITRRTIRNRVFRRALESCEQAVLAGCDIATPLEASGAFSPMVVRMLAVGQEAGEMEQMLARLAESYDLQVATAAARLTAVLEPALIVALAVLVGFITFATILPILEISNVL